MNDMISVIIPVYNSEQYLDRCMKSVLSQSYKSFEVIVVDDGSTDKSLEISLHYQKYDNRVKVVSKKNGGVSSARNVGIKESRGEYIMFVDSDDWLSPDILEVLFRDMQDHKADISICDMNNTMRNFHLESRKGKDFIILNSSQAIKKLLRRNYSSVLAKLYNRKAIQGVEFAEGVNNNEDVLFLYYAFTNANLITHNFRAKKYNIRTEVKDSLSSHKSLKQIDAQIDVLRKIENEVENIKSFKDDLNIYRTITYYNVCGDYIIANLKEKEKWTLYYRAFRKYFLKILFKKSDTIKTKLKFLILFISPKIFKCLKTKLTKDTYFID